MDSPGVTRQQLPLGFETRVGIPKLSLELDKSIESVTELGILCRCTVVRDSCETYHQSSKSLGAARIHLVGHSVFRARQDRISYHKGQYTIQLILRYRNDILKMQVWLSGVMLGYSPAAASWALASTAKALRYMASDVEID